MGCLSSIPKRERSVRNEGPNTGKKKEPENKELDEKIEMVLVGQGESGKSTIFKQMRIIQAQEEGAQYTFTKDERMAARTTVHANLVSQMKALVEAALQEKVAFSSQYAEAFAKQLVEQVIANLDVSSALTGAMIKELWAEASLKALWVDRDRLQSLTDGGGYFWDALDRLYKPDYVPSEEDMVRTRIRTSGFEEASFRYKKHYFRVVDLGGQRSERRLWLEALQMATAVIFVSSLCEFDQRLREDASSSRFVETTLLFNELLENNLKGKCVIILLNKLDLFKAKMQSATRDNFTKFFAEYKGKLEWEPCVSYIRQQFEKLAAPHKLDISIHPIVAIETDSVKLVWSDIRRRVVEDAVRWAVGV